MTDYLRAGGLDQRLLDVLVKRKQNWNGAKRIRWRIKNSSFAPELLAPLAGESDFSYPCFSQCGPWTSIA